MAAGNPGTGYWLTYNVGSVAGSANREDLLDMITMIDPWDTPFFSAAPKSTASLTTHEWITDALAATATGGAPEGGDFGADTLVARSRLNNTLQIFRRDIAVSDTQRAVNPVGIRDEYEYQIMKAMREIARNVESRVFDPATGGVATGASGTARVMKCFADFLTAVGTTGNVISSGGAISSATIASAMEQCYLNGGNPDTLYVSPGVKADISAATLPTGTTRNLANADKRVTYNVDIYEGDFGLLAVVPDRWIRQASASTASSNAFFVERSKARLAFLRPVRHVPIGKGGDSTRGFVAGELTLEVLHPSAHIRVSGLTT